MPVIQTLAEIKSDAYDKRQTVNVRFKFRICLKRKRLDKNKPKREATNFGAEVTITGANLVTWYKFTFVVCRYRDPK